MNEIPIENADEIFPKETEIAERLGCNIEYDELERTQFTGTHVRGNDRIAFTIDWLRKDFSARLYTSENELLSIFIDRVEKIKINDESTGLEVIAENMITQLLLHPLYRVDATRLLGLHTS